MSIIRSGFIIAIFTFISRVFGLVRELVVANFFGTTIYGDIINTAFRFPNLFRRIFGEGALSSVFVPIYSTELITEKKSASKFASEVYTMLFLLLIALTVIFIIFMPQIVLIIAPGFKRANEQYDLAILLCRITIPYMILISMASLHGGIQNSHSRFGAYAFVPILLNIAIIISAFFGDNLEFKSIYVACGIILGGILQFLYMQRITNKLDLKIQFIGLKNVSPNSIMFLKNMVPAIIGNSATQLNLFISSAIASFIPGTISILSYSDRIYQFPLSIIGICFSTVLLPTLSNLHKQKKFEEAIDVQTKAIKLSLFLSFACMFGIISLAHPIIHVIYERGIFSSIDTLKTAETIAIFALGLPAFIINKILTPVFFARLDTKTPLRITTITIAINIALNLLLIKNLEHVGIAIGTSLASWINVGLIIYYCKKSKIKLLSSSITSYIFKLIVACMVMSAILLQLVIFLPFLIYDGNYITKFLSLIIFISIGATMLIGMSQIMGIIAFHEMKYLFRR